MRTLSAILLSMAAASAQAAPQGEVIDFMATWCGPCQQMSPVVSQLERQGYPIRSVDIDQNQDLARKFQVEYLPTFVLVVDGREVNRIVGATSEGQLKRLLGQIPTGDAPVVAETRDMATPTALAAGEPAQQAADASTANGPPKRLFPFSLFGKKDEERGQVQADPMASDPPVVRAKFDESDSLPVSSPKGDVMSASIRIRVKAKDGVNFGSGTIIDSRPGRTVILSCGHMFRELSDSATVEVDVFAKDRYETFVGQVLDYDLEADVGLVAIATEAALGASKIAAAGTAIKPNDAVLSVGCSGGDAPSKQQLRVTELNRYRGPDNIECSGVPVQGRSGGGLFNADNQLIGVCIAADPRDKRGLYCGLKAVHALLDRAALTHLYRPNSQEPGGLAPALASETGAKSGKSQPPAEPAQIEGALGGDNEMATIRSAIGAEDEVVCIIRPRNKPDAPSRIVIINRASPKFVQYLSDELSDQPQPTMRTVKFNQEQRQAGKPVTSANRASAPTAVRSERPGDDERASDQRAARPRATAEGSEAFDSFVAPRRYVRSAASR